MSTIPAMATAAEIREAVANGLTPLAEAEAFLAGRIIAKAARGSFASTPTLGYYAELTGLPAKPEGHDKYVAWRNAVVAKATGGSSVAKAKGKSPAKGKSTKAAIVAVGSGLDSRIDTLERSTADMLAVLTAIMGKLA